MKAKTRFRPTIESLEGRALLNAGALDTSFGGTGMVSTSIGTESGANAVAVQADSKVIVVGWSENLSTGKKSPSGPFTVVRYNTNGTLDSTFGSGGVAVVPIMVNGSSITVSFADQATAVAIQPSDGKILVAGTVDVPTGKNSTSDYSEFVVARLNSNGTLDTTFGGGKGYVITQVSPVQSSGSNGVSSIDLQSNGQIVVGGDLNGNALASNGTYVLALVRYNTNGSLDTTFGKGGEVVNANLSPGGSPTTVAIDGSGRIDVAGQSNAAAGGPVVARYLPNGTLDSTFGTGGIAAASPLGEAFGIGLQSTGQIVVYGTGALVRLNTGGSLDTTFGTNGVYSDSRMSNFESIVIQPTDDKIVAVSGGANGSFLVTRVLADGSAYDSTFGSNGLSEANFSNSGQYGASSVVLDPYGRIVVIGDGYYAPNFFQQNVFATARFLGDSTTSASTMATTSATPSLTTSNTLVSPSQAASTSITMIVPLVPDPPTKDHQNA